MTFSLDELLQDLELRVLRIPVVHHFIQQLIDDHEVITDALLFHLLEIFGEHLDELEQERKDQENVRVPAGYRYKNDSVMLYVAKCISLFVGDDWLDRVFIKF